MLSEVVDKLKIKEEVGEEEVNESFVAGEPATELGNMPDDDVAVDFDVENGNDGAKALEYTRTLKIEYDPHEVEFWFTQIENEMFTCEVKSQWLKRCVLVKNLPPKIQADVKSLLILQKSACPGDIYKQIKTEILRIHAPKKEDAFKKALSRVLTGLPSQLGETLINDICDKPIKLDNCCCHKAIYTLWCIQLPLNVRGQIADDDFNKNTYKAVFQKADKVFLSTKTTEVSPGVAAIATSAEDKSQVAAVTRRNKNQRSGKSGNSNSNNNSAAAKDPKEGNTRRRTRHSSNPPFACCDNHFKWGSDCWYCLAPLTCPWKDKISARPAKEANK